MSFALNAEGQVTDIYIVRNPDKLAGIRLPQDSAKA